MRRAWRIIWRVGLVVVLALTAAVASARWWLPGYLSAWVVSAAEDAGLGPAEVGGVHFGWTWAEVVDLRLGGGRLVLPSVTATFSPFDLLRGRVDDVRVAGGEWTVRVSEGAVDWAPLQLLAAGGARVGAIELPLHRVSVDAFHLRFELPEGEVVQLVWADLYVPPGGRSALVMVTPRKPLPPIPDDPAITHPFTVTVEVDLQNSAVTTAAFNVHHWFNVHDVLARVIEAWSGVLVRGHISVEGAVQSAGVSRKPLTLRWWDGEVSDPGGAWAVRGIDATVELRGLSPWSTSMGQTLHWNTAEFGDIVATDGVVNFGVDSRRVVRIDELSWRIGEGSFATSPFVVDPGAPDIRTRVALEAVSLDRWLSLVTMGRVVGDGRVSGELAFRVATEPRLRFAFGEGEVSADGPGVLSVVDLREAESFVRERELISLDELDYGAEVRDRIVEALGAFAYDLLRFRFERETGTGDVVMRLMTKGRGLRGAKQPFEQLTVNVAGVNELVDEALRQKLGLDRLREQWDRRVPSAAEPGSQGDEP